MKKKKSINELTLNKEVVTKLNLEKINGGKIAEDTYTHKQSPMTSCDGDCNNSCRACW
ncbi:class I lanthipeptide [Flavobacterium sp. LS1R49]|uniref:Class I lanthipeptide n=1 Tax=Flavobacterium shii TaxID=2987687 RepID=A0A9X2ZAB8_9FLAO|nr:class I lanthipeptide [Flavobacterium shii]MCV9926525.1 class I lanthipeptide [Flavobacterium shii]